MDADKIYAEKIIGEYTPKSASKSTSKVAALRKLDARAKRPATITAYTLGIVFALLLGVGMCLTMGVVGSQSTGLFVLGIVVGAVGIAGVSMNYPLYKHLIAKGKQKYAFEIMELAHEISE